jgi:hypothetical protein
LTAAAALAAPRASAADASHPNALYLLYKGEDITTARISLICTRRCWDLHATVLEAAGVAHPDKFQGHDVLPLGGKSLLPTFENKPGELHDTIFWAHSGNRAARQATSTWCRCSRIGGGSTTSWRTAPYAQPCRRATRSRQDHDRLV